MRCPGEKTLVIYNRSISTPSKSSCCALSVRLEIINRICQALIRKNTDKIKTKKRDKKDLTNTEISAIILWQSNEHTFGVIAKW